MFPTQTSVLANRCSYSERENIVVVENDGYYENEIKTFS